ncbi:TPA: hypothetical protein DF272_04680 [Candidatus Falkowbacteria bacterium]|nr:hypothetical protein [Candidatus Falkowbacteria bacterium]
MLTMAEKQAVKLFWIREKIWESSSWGFLSDVLTEVSCGKHEFLNERYTYSGLLFQALKKMIDGLPEIVDAIANLEYWKRRIPIGPRKLTAEQRKERDIIHMATRSNITILAENFNLLYAQEVDPSVRRKM